MGLSIIGIWRDISLKSAILQNKCLVIWLTELVILKKTHSGIGQHPFVVDPKNAFYYDEIQYSLPVSLLINGEAIRIRFLYNGNVYFADLMKMTESEFIVLQTDFGNLHNQKFMQIYANDTIGENEAIFIPSCGHINIVKACLLKPLDYYSYADWHFMRNLWRFDVNENLWHVYNSLSEFVDERISWDSFQKMMDVFCKNGLSTFVFRLMLNSIKR